MRLLLVALTLVLGGAVGLERKIIMLFWDMPEGAMVPEPIETPSGRCIPTNDKRTVDFADVVVFYMRYVDSLPEIERPWGALWVFQVWESPATQNHRYEDFLATMNSQLNLFVGYSSKANITTPYGSYTAGSTDFPFGTAFFEMRSLIVGMISDCDSPSRTESIRRLSSFIPIDIMGKSYCATRSVIPECATQGVDQRGCFQALSQMYIFYFAVENSDCEDYITEKIWLNSFNGLWIESLISLE